MKNLLIGLLISVSLYAHAETGGWISRDGKAVPNTDAMKSMNGFGASLIVTPDPDWEEKWNTKPEETPNFSEVKDISYGDKLTILAFYINPKTNAAGELEILCDIKVIRPDGSASTNASGVRCASGRLQGDPHNIRMSSAVIKFVGEAGDPPGKWTIEMTLTDTVRGTAIPLKAYFNLRKAADNHAAPPVSATPEQPTLRCGWFSNPSPNNVWLTDREAEWIISIQGGHEADGEWPRFAEKDWVNTNRSYGYGCACLTVVADVESKQVQRILSSKVKPLKACREDRALKKPAT